jgi:hypothetical protein
MFSRFFGKRDKSADVPTKEAPRAGAPVKTNDVPDSATGKSDRSLRAPGSRLPASQPVAARVVPKAVPARPVSTVPADHQIDFVLPSAPMALDAELSLAPSKDIALATVEQHHQRIANTIRTLWGYRECSVYINRLIMAGGDGMGHARVGFNQEAVAAMLALSDIHDAEFGAPSTLSGGLGLAL